MRAPSSFSNPDFAQLCGGPDGETPSITFTPAKNARAVKEGLIHPKFLKIKPAAASAKSLESNSLVEEIEPAETEDEEQDAPMDVDLDRESIGSPDHQSNPRPCAETTPQAMSDDPVSDSHTVTEAKGPLCF